MPHFTSYAANIYISTTHYVCLSHASVVEFLWTAAILVRRRDRGNHSDSPVFLVSLVSGCSHQSWSMQRWLCECWCLRDTGIFTKHKKRASEWTPSNYTPHDWPHLLICNLELSWCSAKTMHTFYLKVTTDTSPAWPLAVGSAPWAVFWPKVSFSAAKEFFLAHVALGCSMLMTVRRHEIIVL